MKKNEKKTVLAKALTSVADGMLSKRAWLMKQIGKSMNMDLS